MTTDAGPTLDHLHLTSGQIGFPATQVASADANTLDDYEKGTWTPVNPAVTLTTALGKYTKFGNITHPLKEEFRRRKIPLWCLSKYTGVSEPKLSRYFNRIDDMPFNLQFKLYELLDILNGNLSSLVEKQILDQESGNIKPDSNLDKVNKE